MKLTLSVLKADVGSVGGHTKPTQRMVDAVKDEVKSAIKKSLLVDGFVSFTGDDIAILCSHKKGVNNSDIHMFAWNCFLKATDIAREYGLYGAGQDLLVDAPSGNIKGAGPGVAELEFEHNPVKGSQRPAESFMVFACDKCCPGAFNLPLFLGFADPMYCAGLMLPAMIDGFTFKIVDMNNSQGDSVLELNTPEDYYKLSVLLRDNERFGISSISSRKFGLQSVAASTSRLHNISGTYSGKDDPIVIIRNQGIFPAPEELVSPYAKAHYVGGDARGSHVMPLMPVPINTPVTGMYCLPIVSCLGFSIDKNGKFSENYVDFFDNPAWDEVRVKAQQKAFLMREQGWSGAAMLPYNELEYSGFRDTVTSLVNKFSLKSGSSSKKYRK